MNRLWLPVAFAVLVAGCQSPTAAETPNAGEKGTESAQTQTNAGASGGGDGIAPMTPSPIPNAPISGAESVQGAGAGGTGLAAKDLARRKTADAGSGSLGQAQPDTE